MVGEALAGPCTDTSRHRDRVVPAPGMRPALGGLLANHVGVQHALTAAVGLLAPGLLATSACRPLDTHDTATAAANVH